MNIQEQITSVEFDQYLQVQFSGVTNMYDVKKVEQLSGLDPEQIKLIMSNYNTLKDIYSDEYNNYV